MYYFVINVLGLSVGGAAVGIVTDYVFGDEMALRYTLSLISAVAGVMGLMFLRVHLKYYRVAIVEAERW
jgi:hypothetical protein